MRKIACIFILICLTFLLASCVTTQNANQKNAALNQQAAALAEAKEEARQKNINNEQDRPYIIGNGDTLTVRLWNEENMDRSLKVDYAGGINYPLVGYVNVNNLSIPEAKDRLAAALKKYYVSPEVEVFVTNIVSKRYCMVGEVTKPGTYPMDHRLTIWEAIAASGGYTTNAEEGFVLVARGSDPNANLEKIYTSYSRGHKGLPGSNVYVESDDIIIVLPTLLYQFDAFLSRISSIMTSATNVARTAIVFKQLENTFLPSSTSTPTTTISY